MTGAEGPTLDATLRGGIVDVDVYGPDATWLVTASGDFQFSFGALTFWDTATGRELAVLNLAGPVESVSVQPGTGAVVAGYRTTEDLVEVGGAWLVPGPTKWVALACAGTDGTIGDQTSATITGEQSPHRNPCPERCDRSHG